MEFDFICRGQIKRKILKELLQNINVMPTKGPLLVAGCGQDGTEAKTIQKIFNLQTFGLDIKLVEKIEEENSLELINGDLSDMPYENGKFEFIYCHHVLEHVKSPSNVIYELNRVLKKNGIIFIGFPNRLRIMPMYFNSNEDLTISQIISYNWNDYRKKISGKFKNELGAHAGFSRNEFIKLSEDLFNVSDITNEYVSLLYPKFKRIIKFVELVKLGNILYPSNYFILRKK